MGYDARSPVSGDINDSQNSTGHLGSKILEDQWHTISALGRMKCAFPESIIPLLSVGLSPVSSFDLFDPRPHRVRT